MVELALGELVDHLEKVAVVAMVGGPDGKSALLLTWHWGMAFKTMVTSAWKGVCGMEVVDLLGRYLGSMQVPLTTVVKVVNLLHKDSWDRVSKYLARCMSTLLA